MSDQLVWNETAIKQIFGKVRLWPTFFTMISVMPSKDKKQQHMKQALHLKNINFDGEETKDGETADMIDREMGNAVLDDSEVAQSIMKRKTDIPTPMLLWPEQVRFLESLDDRSLDEKEINKRLQRKRRYTSMQEDDHFDISEREITATNHITSVDAKSEIESNRDEHERKKSKADASLPQSIFETVWSYVYYGLRSFVEFTNRGEEVLFNDDIDESDDETETDTNEQSTSTIKASTQLDSIGSDASVLHHIVPETSLSAMPTKQIIDHNHPETIEESVALHEVSKVSSSISLGLDTSMSTETALSHVGLVTSKKVSEGFSKQLIFERFLRAGYIVGPADVYGADYTLYKGDDPSTAHSVATVLVHNDSKISPQSLIAFSRVQNQVAKSAVVAFPSSRSSSSSPFSSSTTFSYSSAAAMAEVSGDHDLRLPLGATEISTATATIPSLPEAKVNGTECSSAKVLVFNFRGVSIRM